MFKPEKFLLKVVGDTGMQRETEENAGSIIQNVTETCMKAADSS